MCTDDFDVNPGYYSAANEILFAMDPAVAELYRVFQPYRLGADFSGCAHCVPQHVADQLAAIPLHELTVPDVDQYAFKAMTTWGSQAQFKHFLPRLLDLAFEDFLAFGFPEVLLGKLAYAQWTTWSRPEQNAVCEFLDTFWRHQLTRPGNFPHDERIRTAVGGLAEACDSLGPFLTTWSQQRGSLSALHLAQLVEDVSNEVLASGTVELWGNHPVQQRELVLWLSSENAYSLANSSRDLVVTTFPDVFGQLDSIRAAMSQR